MKRTSSAILVAFLLLAGTAAYARVDVNISVGAPVVVAPAPQPQVVVPAPPAYGGPVVEYRYYPSWNVYLDPISGLFWSLQGGTWVHGGLPHHVPPGQLGRYVVVPAEEGRPWHHVEKRYYKHRKHEREDYDDHDRGEHRGRGW